MDDIGDGKRGCPSAVCVKSWSNGVEIERERLRRVMLLLFCMMEWEEAP